MKNKKEIEEFVEKLKETDKLIIIEGIKDKRALEELGLNKIVTLNKKPLFEVIEKVAEDNKEVIILTDLDVEGRKLYSKLKRGLTERGVTVDNYFREFLFRKTKLSQIEGLTRYLHRF